MAIRAHLDQPTAGDSQRSAPRRALRLETSGLSPDGEETNVTIHNISAAGLLIETALDLATGEELALDLPLAGVVSASVVWRSEHLYGCAFERALGPAALAAAQLQGFAPGVPSQPLGTPAPPAATGPTLGTAQGEALGARLNRFRREAGLTLAEVAATLGVSKPTVWAWEKGKARPLPERLDAIAAALGVAPETLAAAPGSGAAGPLDSVIADCRARIAEASGTDPQAVRIMIEL
ncbi:helix-turn-helix domain-containing protein [Porphyrobacter sp. YT40]|uniref:helix-turn-helix domain-containing protein n=1 Tax=Porphyrobacter sp. YT40 TaxID=2547601 RepID=UPI001141E228|nr:helix-turn-helix domain-containing protein [Porphyrobacter sp. YT40]QDH33144.1 helix-turn-helix domain-containing protein [Porphyrobacter sp. YT40]